MESVLEKGFKVIILGDSGVGKTSIYNSLTGKPSMDTSTTVGGDTTLIHCQNVLVALNDTAGQEVFKSICQNYYREPQVVIFVFDINRLETFMNIPDWQQEVTSRNNEKVPIKYYLVANKRDLQPNKSLAGVETFAQQNNMTLIITSVKDDITINELKTQIFDYILENKEKGKPTQTMLQLLHLNKTVDKVYDCCRIG